MREQTADLKQIAIETAGMYQLYNAFGRGKIEEWNFCFMAMRNDLGKWIKKTYTKEEIAERLHRLDLI